MQPEINTYNQEETTPPLPIWYRKFVEREAQGNIKIQQMLFQLLVPMSLEQWCSIWVPQFHNVSPGTYGYKIACVSTLTTLTGYSEGTISVYLTKRKKRKHLPILGLTLRLLHIVLLLTRAYVQVSKKR